MSKIRFDEELFDEDSLRYTSCWHSTLFPDDTRMKKLVVSITDAITFHAQSSPMKSSHVAEGSILLP